MYTLYVYTNTNMCEKQFFVYILESSNRTGNTYVGATVDLTRRLRQHNKELAGGAHATSIHGNTWRRVCNVSGFPTWSAALQFEWKLKHISRNLTMTMTNSHAFSIKAPISKRLIALHQLLQLEKSTKNSIPFIEWNSPPFIAWECNACEEYYNNLEMK